MVFTSPAHPSRLLWRLTWLLASVVVICTSSLHGAGCLIVVDPQADAIERFAARELQRYVYLRTTELATIQVGAEPPARGFVVAAEKRALGRRVAGGDRPLGAQAYRITAAPTEAGSVRAIVTGGDSIGTLYGIYRLAEMLGVRFYAHGDVVPDTPVPLDRLRGDEMGRPLFSVRGLQPFHDFPEGPDWWNTDDYLAIIGQLAKLRMNFLGLHTYPESEVGPEPTVWIGLPEDDDGHGNVRRAYPASYHTTGRGGNRWWAHAPQRTSDFTGGTATLFERDDFGADVMLGHPFDTQTPETAVDVFNRTGAMLGAAFAHARQLGVLTCLGTETPLTVPAAVKARLIRSGRNPDDPNVIRELYRAMFERIARVSPADYYWLWTPENWTWEGNRPEHFAKTAADIQAALGALQDLRQPMTLATCGWVLGPQHDRSALDRLLPPNAPMSAINASVGHVAIDRGFTRIHDRPRWAIPWLENDGTLTTPELWAGRMRFDAADALRLGCTGLIGIHWRTRSLAPAISALASAAWDQSWVPADFSTARVPSLTASGATGGHPVKAVTEVAAGVPAVYATNRVGMQAYDLLVPNGTYQVRLGFSELEQAKAGARVFDVKLNGATVIQRLDVAAQKDAAIFLTREFRDVRITDGRMLVEFVPHAGEPAVASIEIAGVTDVGQAPYSRRINCGGPLSGEYEADELPGQPRPPGDRSMPVEEFYRDFATANFGGEAAPDIARVLARIDGVALPTPTRWIDGPGDIDRNPASWDSESPKYAFVAELETLRTRVQGAANLDRYDYWLNQFRAARLVARLGCTAGALDRVMPSIAGASDLPSARERARREALPLRVELAHGWTELLRTEMAAVSNPGELGTIANLEQRSRLHARFLTRHDEALVQALGLDLPLTAMPSRDYAGPARLVVPTVRTSASAGEVVAVRMLVVAARDSQPPELCWRWLGEHDYRRSVARHLGRGVFQADLPALSTEHPSLEYHFEATLDGESRRWPVSDRGMDQMVVLLERT